MLPTNSLRQAQLVSHRSHLQRLERLGVEWALLLLLMLLRLLRKEASLIRHIVIRLILVYSGGGFRIDEDLGNPDLEPEIKTEWEIGADLRLFRDRLSLGMTYYQNDIDGIIIRTDLTPSFGYDTQVLNAASMENKGFEWDLDYSIIETTDLRFGVYANWSTNRNMVTSLAETSTIDLSGGSVSSRAIGGSAFGRVVWFSSSDR